MSLPSDSTAPTSPRSSTRPRGEAPRRRRAACPLRQQMDPRGAQTLAPERLRGQSDVAGPGCYTRIMPTEVARNAMDRILDPVSRCLTPEAAKRLTELRADGELQARVEEL